MNWDELKNEWTRQAAPIWDAAALAKLEREFAAKQREQARMIFHRDLREAGAGLFVAVVFGWVGWKMGRPGWPMAVAVLPILGLSGFFLRERQRARRQQPLANASLLVRLDAEIAEQARQHWLLSHVAIWYLGPCLLGGGIFGATVLMNAPLPAAPRLSAAGIMVLAFALTGWFVIWLNRRAVRDVIEPRLQELNAWREILISSK